MAAEDEKSTVRGGKLCNGLQAAGFACVVLSVGDSRNRVSADHERGGGEDCGFLQKSRRPRKPERFSGIELRRALMQLREIERRLIDVEYGDFEFNGHAQ